MLEKLVKEAWRQSKNHFCTQLIHFLGSQILSTQDGSSVWSSFIIFFYMIAELFEQL